MWRRWDGLHPTADERQLRLRYEELLLSLAAVRDTLRDPALGGKALDRRLKGTSAATWAELRRLEQRLVRRLSASERKIYDLLRGQR
jgi:hypothetical protein